MVGYLLDTIVFIWAVRGLHSADRVLARLRGEDVAVTAERHARQLVTYSPAHYPLAGCELSPLTAFLGGGDH